ncbi:MAG: sialidase family protein [Ekhidna sp.]
MVLTLVSVTATCTSQPTHFAELDQKREAIVGKTYTITSAFEGLPVVEPHISVHPSNNDHLLVAAMVVTDTNRPYQSCRLSSFVSKDGGLTWKETAHDWWGYDPWTAILPNGSTVMTWLGTEESFKGQFPVQFFFSEDGGETWIEQSQTIQGKGHGHDGTKVVGFEDKFYFTTVQFNGNMGADVVLLGRDGAGEFNQMAVVDGKGERLNFCEPAVLSDGTVIVPSSHFMERLWVQQFDIGSGNLSDRHLVTARPGGAGGYIRMVADNNQDSPFKDRIYVVRALGRGNAHEGIWLNYSVDKGVTWSRDTRIDLFDNDLPPKSLVPSLAVNSGGVLGISWVDAQHDPEQLLKDVYFTLSKDGGVSFQRPVRVTKVSSSPQTSKNGEVARRFPGGGHYLGLDAKPDGSFQLIWSDSRSGIFELQTANISIAN